MTEMWLVFGGALISMGVMFFGFNALWKWLGNRLFSPPRAVEAMAVCWQAMGMQMKDCPRVYWVRGKSYSGPNGEVAGESGPGWSNVAWWDGAKFSETALAHEFAHHVRWVRGASLYENRDVVHNDPVFTACVALGTAALVTWEAA